LEKAGIIERTDAPPPVAATLFSLTDRGLALEPLIHELSRWGAPLMRDMAPDDEFRGQWLKLLVRTYLTDRHPDRPASTVEVRAGDQTVAIDAAAGKVSMRLGPDPDADAVITGSPPVILRLITGAVTLERAIQRGLQVDRSRAAVERILPDPPPAQPRT
jgi:hypothetical protein